MGFSCIPVIEVKTSCCALSALFKEHVTNDDDLQSDLQNAWLIKWVYDASPAYRKAKQTSEEKVIFM